MTEEYRVQLDVFSGPLDLLLYLIRRDELDIQDIPIARLTEQYLAYLRLLEQLDPNTAGDFLVMASTLLEIKSRALLPTPPLEPLEGEAEDPRTTLVRQLLEYKRFKDAARALESAADERAKRYVRQPVDLPAELAGLDLEEVQVWDLLEAFGRVMTAIGQGPSRHQVVYDDTPIEFSAAQIVSLLQRGGPTTFQSLFEGQAGRSAIVGRFLALLELIRSHRVRAEQDRNFGTIYLFLLQEIDEPVAELPAEPTSSGPDVAAMPGASEPVLQDSDESDRDVFSEALGDELDEPAMLDLGDDIVETPAERAAEPKASPAAEAADAKPPDGEGP